VVLDPKKLVFDGLAQEPSIVSMLIAVGTFTFFTKYAGDETRIKWPNDIYWRDRKAAGILIENSFRGPIWQWSIAGMGININQTNFGTDLHKAVSLKQMTGKTYDVKDLAVELCKCIQDTLDILVNEGPNAIIALYNNALYKKGALVTVAVNEVIKKVTICRVLPNGYLEFEHENGTKESAPLGTVKWLP
jgi:BirA family biotin operon repressor/biotin-[acetyl-CoA-carboxylase] ligase